MGPSSRRLLVAAAALALIAFGGIGATSASAAFTQCPPVDLNSGCQFLITVTDSETTVESDPTQGPYEGADDALIGIQNNSSKTIASLPLSAEDELFGFENDGICSPGGEPLPPGCVVLPENSSKEKTLNPDHPCPPEIEACGFPAPAGEPTGITFPESIGINGYAANGDPVTGYEGPTTWFTNIASNSLFTDNSGVVNFSGGLKPGEHTYFSLESPPAGGFGTATTLSTTLTGGGQIGAAISVLQGTPVTDTATLSGAGASSATGKVTYSVYGDAGCTQLAASAGTGAVSGGVAAASSALSGLAAGKYYWRASYGGDINNLAVSSTCGTEVLTVLAPTTTTTVQSGGGASGASITAPVGSPVNDTAHIAGPLAAASTGTVSYVLYKDNKCTVPAAAASAAAVNKGVVGPSAALKPAAGTYYWRAIYSGDAVNAGSASACGSEVLVVAKKANLGLPAVKGCVSKRKFIAHPRAPKGVKLVSVEVLVNGKRKFKGGLVKRHTTINLQGLPKGTFKVALIARSSTGQTYEDLRTFHTCVPKKRHHKKK